MNPTNWTPIINKKSGKPPGYISWDTFQKRIDRITQSIILLSELKIKLEEENEKENQTH